MPGYLLKELSECITTAGSNTDVRVIILESEGEKAFCAGASFDELASIEDFQTGVEFFSGFANVINAIRKANVLVIGRIQGRVVGGGLGLVAACDYSLAHKSASVRLSEYSLGIGPFVIAPAVERKIGKSALAQMTIDTEWYDAEWAYQKGLFNKLFDELEILDNTLNELAYKISSLSPEASKELKLLFWEGTSDWDSLLIEKARISGRLVLGEYTKNFINRFKSK
jgi:methylglutaconyl-CoA hydratase